MLNIGYRSLRSFCVSPVRFFSYSSEKCKPIMTLTDKAVNQASKPVFLTYLTRKEYVKEIVDAKDLNVEAIVVTGINTQLDVSEQSWVNFYQSLEESSSFEQMVQLIEEFPGNLNFSTIDAKKSWQQFSLMHSIISLNFYPEHVCELVDLLFRRGVLLNEEEFDLPLVHHILEANGRWDVKVKLIEHLIKRCDLDLYALNDLGLLPREVLVSKSLHGELIPEELFKIFPG